MRGDRFAFSYRERNKREVSIKNVKIENSSAFARFEYQKARYDCRFIFENNELALLTTEYEHDDLGKFLDSLNILSRLYPPQNLKFLGQ